MTASLQSKINIPVILGPTAAGKTALAIEIASAYGFEIVSCDSRQVYRHMDIGTAKPSKEEMNRVRHWLVDCVDPDTLYSAFQFVEDATVALKSCVARGPGALMAGGTGLYFHALYKGFSAPAESAPALKRKLMERLAVEGNGALYRELRQADPETAGAINPNDWQRTVRALAVYLQTGQPLSRRKPARHNSDFSFTPVVVTPVREELYRRINVRVVEMARRGLFEEFRSLLAKGYSEISPGLRCVGYRELFAVERNELPLCDALELIKQHTRNYAKRQLTWFRGRLGDRVIEIAGDGAGAVKKVGHALGLS